MLFALQRVKGDDVSVKSSLLLKNLMSASAMRPGVRGRRGRCRLYRKDIVMSVAAMTWSAENAADLGKFR